MASGGDVAVPIRRLHRFAMPTPGVSESDSSIDRGPAVRFPPPLPYVVAFGVGALLERYAPLPITLLDVPWLGWVGLALMAAGLITLATGMLTFRNARTPIYPNAPATTIVTHGIYRVTRNPMYVGLATLYLGGVAATAMVWPLLLLPPVIALIYTQVIRREERHLHRAFPEEYGAYTRRVRRWL